MTNIENIQDANDYKNLVDLLAVHSEASNRMLELQARIQGEYMELIDGAKPEYAKFQAVIGDAEAALKALALAHPDWFPKERKSIKTPYGTVKFTSTTSLEINDEEATILLIEHAGRAKDFLRVKQEVDCEALEKLDDAALKAFRVKRVADESFKVTPATLDMGKAVQDAAKAKEKGKGKAVAK